MTTQAYSLKRDRIELLMRAQGYEFLKEVAEEAKFQPRKITRWLNKPDSIKATDLGLIADVLKTTVDYLIGRSDDPGVHADRSHLTEAELDFLAILHSKKRDEARELLFNFIRDNPDLM